MKKEYSAKLTGNSFLYLELKVVAVLHHQGLGREAIKQRVLDENLFQYKALKSVPKRLGAIFERVAVLDNTLLTLLVSEPNETGRLIALYSIMKTDTLFFEFMKELVCEKWKLRQPRLSKMEVHAFFNTKARDSMKVASFTEATLVKLQQVYLKLLLEAGLLREDHTIDPPIMNSSFVSHLSIIGEKEYLEALLGGTR